MRKGTDFAPFLRNHQGLLLLKNIKYFQLILCVCLSFGSAAQQLIVNWQRVAGGERNEVAYSGVETSDGGYMVVGSTNSKNTFDVKDSRGYDGVGGNDFWVVKVNNAGVIEWSKTFGGTKDDIATSVVKTPNDEYVILGTTQSNDGDAQYNGTNVGLLMVRLKLNGDVVAKRLFAGGSQSASVKYAEPSSFYKPTLKVLSNGQLVVAASRSTGVAPFTGYDYYLALLSAFGDTIWEKTFGGGLEDFPNDIIQTSDGNLLMVGGTLSLERDIPGAGQGFYDVLAIKVDALGRQVWEKGYGGLGYDVGYAVMENSTKNGYYILGESSSSNVTMGTSLGEKDGIILKISPTGLLENRYRFGGADNDGLYHFVRGEDGLIYAVGTSQSDIGTVTTRGTLTDLWLMVLNETTMKADHHKLLGGADIDLARSVTYNSKKGLFIAGSSRSTDTDVALNRGQSDFWILNMTPPPPILFGKFDVFLNENQYIELKWTTTFENNSQYILVEKSVDNKTFNTREEVSAAGSSNAIKTYNYVDKNPVFGKNYYRLRYVDATNKYYSGPSGSYTYTPLATEPATLQAASLAYPNPASGSFFVKTKIKNPEFELTNVLGLRLPLRINQISDDEFGVEINNQKVEGLYLLKIYNSEEKQVLKVLLK